MHGHRSLDGTLNPGGEVLETKSLSQLNRYWYSAAFSITLIALQVLCATPVHAEELASRPIGPRVLRGMPSVSRLTPPAPAQRDTPIHVRVPIHIPVPIPAPAPTFDLERRRQRQLAARLSLYASFAATSLLEVHATRQALDAGGAIVGPFGGHPAALLAFKGGTTAGMVFLAERLWKDRKYKTVMATLAALTVMNAFIAGHNYRVASRLP